MTLRARLRPVQFLVWAVLTACALILVEYSYSRQASAGERLTVARITEGLTCQCGCGLTVSNCNHPTCGFAVPLRDDIDKMIAKGMSADQITAFYRRKYGEKILSAPTTEGFNLLAWIMPFAAIIAGGGLIALRLGRWRTAPVQEAEQIVPLFDDDLRRRLESDLKDGL